MNFSLKKLFLILSFSFFISAFSFAQIETVPADHPVYPFLKKMHVQGILPAYDDFILPLSRKKIEEDLLKIDSSKNKLSSSEAGFLNLMLNKFGVNKNSVKQNLFDDFPSNFGEKLFSENENHLYSYADSSVSFYLDPVLDLKVIHQNSVNKNASLLNFGGTFRGTYENWFGFYLQGSDGVVWGNRQTALIDQRVKQSYTFNNTGINYFDGTKGYVRLEHKNINLQLGRERVLWGAGYINRMILSENPQMFDFVKFHFGYKSLSYDFIHGWLVVKPVVTYVDSLEEDVKLKPSKYIAISRFNYKPVDYLSFGVSQIIIYGNRPFELAYFNPFLFWESAQRSLNDLDNSFLSFDGRFNILKGLEISSAITFDDLNFSRLSKGEWTGSNNGEMWKIAAFLTKPFLLNDMVLKLEYAQVRPYMFSHPNVSGDLTYTNNGYLLGENIQPNSTKFSVGLDYLFFTNLSAGFLFSHQIHGNNIYDNKGNLIKNVGGYVYDHLRWEDPIFTKLLAGDKDYINNYRIELNFLLSSILKCNLIYSHFSYKKNNFKDSANNIEGILQFYFD